MNRADRDALDLRWKTRQKVKVIARQSCAATEIQRIYMKYYTEDHEWVEINGETAVIGISEYVADELGEITYVELPEEDDDFIIGDRLGEVESDKTSCDIYSPISGTVYRVNENLADDPALINESPEDKGWICKMVNFDSSELDDMMTEDAYLKVIDTL